MEEDNLNSIIQGILEEAANRIREALAENMGANSEVTRSLTKFDAQTADGDVIVLDAETERAGTVVGLCGTEWMYKYPTGKHGFESKRWESWDGVAVSASNFAATCRASHASGNTPDLIHKGY